MATDVLFRIALPELTKCIRNPPDPRLVGTCLNKEKLHPLLVRRVTLLNFVPASIVFGRRTPNIVQRGPPGRMGLEAPTANAVPLFLNP